jgi:hypothetical protein
MRSTWDEVLTAYIIDVPSIGLNCGSPAYVTSSFASLRLIAAVCGIWAS